MVNCRALSVLIVFIMVVSMMPTAAFAGEISLGLPCEQSVSDEQAPATD